MTKKKKTTKFPFPYIKKKNKLLKTPKKNIKQPTLIYPQNLYFNHKN